MNEIESAIIGMCLNNPRNLERFLAHGVRPTDFSEAELSLAFSKIIEADSKDEPFDIVAMSLRLPGVHWPIKLQNCSELASSTQNPAYYAGELKREAFRKDIQRFSLEVSTLGLSTELSIEEMRSKLVNDVDKVCANANESDTSSMADDAMEFVYRLDEIKRKGKPDSFSCGLPSTDALIQGFKPGAIYIIGARTGVGKTEIALNFAWNLAASGCPTAFFSFEMPKHEILARIVSRLSGVSAVTFMNGLADHNQNDRIADALRTIGTSPLTIRSPRQALWDDLKLLIRTLVRRNGARVVFVDYVQLLNSVGFRASERVRELTVISQQAKGLAIQLNIAIVLLAQLNRSGAQTNESPKLIHLKESGSLEQDGDVIMLLNRIDPHNKSIIDLDIQKNRHGPERIVPLYFDYSKHTVRER